MRKIKFRAWDKKYRKMYYGDIRVALAYPDEDIMIMQYTGLKDKNGKEIYEGDILYLSYMLFKNSPPIEETLVVSYRQDGFYALKPTNEDDSPALGVLRYYTKTFEVIGNIHENPELLKGGNNNVQPPEKLL